jgi:hypothetical protein
LGTLFLPVLIVLRNVITSFTTVIFALMPNSSEGRTLTSLCCAVFIDKLLFGLKPLSERELTSVRYAMKSEHNQDTRVTEPRIECNVFVKKR